ncbi:MAG: hypothetical protein ACP5FU_06780, partial [Nitrososphaeria archaeon]
VTKTEISRENCSCCNTKTAEQVLKQILNRVCSLNFLKSSIIKATDWQKRSERIDKMFLRLQAVVKSSNFSCQQQIQQFLIFDHNFINTGRIETSNISTSLLHQAKEIKSSFVEFGQVDQELQPPKWNFPATTKSRISVSHDGTHISVSISPIFNLKTPLQS